MKKGFASAGIIYTLLVIFLILTFTTLSTMQNKKTVLDNLKEETVNALYCNQNIINELKNQIKELQKIVATKNNEISNLKNIGNATASQILSGKKALVKGKEITGTMNNINGNISAKNVLVASDLTKFQINTPGYYDTNDYLYVNNSTLASKIGLTASKLAKGKKVLGVSGTYTSDATANNSQILSGKTAYVNGSKVTGTMADRGLAQYGGWGCGSNGCGSGNNAYYAINSLPEGYYHSDGNSWAPEARINANTLRAQLGVSANKIISGQSIAGVSGSIPSRNNGIAVNSYLWDNYLVAWIPSGYYPGWQNLNGTYYGEAWIRRSDLANTIGLSANKIVQGQSIAGVSGTANCSNTPYILTINAWCNQPYGTYNWEGGVRIYDSLSGAALFDGCNGSFYYKNVNYSVSCTGDTVYGKYDPWIRVSVYDNAHGMYVTQNQPATSVRKIWNGSSYQNLT